MPLDAAGLQSDLEAFFADPHIVLVAGEVDVTASRLACAREWADAMQAYAADIVPPSTTVVAAAAALKGSLASAFALPSASTAVDAAFLAFATAIGGGMAGFTPAPPLAPLSVATLLGATAATHADAATSFASTIDVWMKTGTATPIPSGPPANWS